MQLKTNLDHALKDRPFLLRFIGYGAMTVIISVLFALQIKPSQLNLPNRYSAFGVTNIYNDTWYYLLSFVAFIVILFFIHNLISLKLFQLKGPVVARFFLSLSIILLIIEAFLIDAVLKIASLPQ